MNGGDERLVLVNKGLPLGTGHELQPQKSGVRISRVRQNRLLNGNSQWHRLQSGKLNDSKWVLALSADGAAVVSAEEENGNLAGAKGRERTGRAGAEPNRLLSRNLARIVESFFQTPARHQSGNFRRMDVGGELASLVLGFQHVLPALGNLSGGNKIFVVDD